MPRALQAKRAREMDRSSTLSKSLDILSLFGIFKNFQPMLLPSGPSLTGAKWLSKQSRMYIICYLPSRRLMHATSRARYLRLPSPGPKHQSKLPEISTRTSPSGLSHRPFARRSKTPMSDDGSETPDSRYALAGTGLRWRHVGVSQSKGESSPERKPQPERKARDPSPAPSAKSTVSNWYSRGRTPRLDPDPPQSEDGRGRLWAEFQDIRRRSRPPSQHSTKP
jgi:hypothetical protein